MMPSLPRVRFIKTKVILGIITKVFQTKFHQIRITKSKVINVQIPEAKWEKTKKLEKNFWLQNRVIKGLQIGGSFRNYKSGQEGFQIGAS